MDSYKLSVILTIIDDADLDKSIDSVIKQNKNGIELVCIDNGLNENISEILKSYSEEFNFIKVYHENITDVNEARNYCIAKSKGKYIAFLNSNDYFIDENALDMLYEQAVKSGTNIASGNIKLINPNGKLRAFPKIGRYEEDSTNPIEDYGAPKAIYRNIFKREFLTDNKIVFPDLSSGNDEVFLAECLSKSDSFCSIPMDIYAHNMKSIECSDYIRHYVMALNQLEDSRFSNVYQDYKYEFFTYLKKISQEDFEDALNTVRDIFKDNPDELRIYEYLVYKDNVSLRDVMDTDHPRVSVLIPVYNASKFLDKSLGSLINQSFEDFEIVCVNDGSKDDSLDILNDYASRDNRIKVIDQENGGCGAARNEAFRNAKGDYVYFFDPDDFVALDAFERMYENIIFNESDFVVCRGNSFNDDGFINTRLFFNYKRYFKDINFNKFTFNYDDEKRIVLNDYFAPWAKLYKREFLEKNNLAFDIGLAFDDVPFHVRTMVNAKRISHVNRSLYHYRVDNANSVNSTPSNAGDIFKIIDIVKGILDSAGIFEEFECNFVAFEIVNITSLILKSDSEQFYATARRYFNEMSKDCVDRLNGLYLRKYDIIMGEENYTEFKIKYLQMLLDNEKSKLDKRILNSNEKIRNLKSENEELKDQVKDLNLKYNRLNSKHKKLVKLNDELLNSTSWKITKPLRKIKNG